MLPSFFLNTAYFGPFSSIFRLFFAGFGCFWPENDESDSFNIGLFSALLSAFHTITKVVLQIYFHFKYKSTMYLYFVDFFQVQSTEQAKLVNIFQVQIRVQPFSRISQWWHVMNTCICVMCNIVYCVEEFVKSLHKKVEIQDTLVPISAFEVNKIWPIFCWSKSSFWLSNVKNSSRSSLLWLIF